MSGELIAKALSARRESKHVEFKQSFDPNDNGNWCELIKDLTALANSGGGVLLIGVNNDGTPSKADVGAVLALDSAKFADKLQKYVRVNFDGFEIHESIKQGESVALIEVAGAEFPLIFEVVGSYCDSKTGKQKDAFVRGTIYFRHGAKSEPGTAEDIRKFVEARISAIKKMWLEGIRKIAAAPTGSSISIFSGEVVESGSDRATPIRLVDDPGAPGYRLIDHDITYPYRQKELLEVVNRMLPSGVHVNSHDLLAVRRVHGIDSNRAYAHKPKFATPQYSDAFVKWIVDQHKTDPSIFAKARALHHR